MNAFRSILALSVLLISAFQLRADEHDHLVRINKIEFVENKGQWNSKALFKADVNAGTVWLEKNCFTWVFQNMDDVRRMHEENHSGNVPYAATGPIRSHAFLQKFINSDNPIVSGNNKLPHYHNYFLGNNPEQWASMVPLFSKVYYKNLYSGIDVEVYSDQGNFKYDYIVKSGINPHQILFTYEGTDGVKIQNGNLVISTSIGEIIEQHPIAYQVTKKGKVNVPCQFKEISKGVYGFNFPEGFDKNYELIIDPVVIAATYSGSTSTIYGHTATYDAAGNIYSAGACFSGGGYPTTVGAFQTNPAGGRDIAVTKYNPNGSAQIWATQIGGSNDDYPHSMVVNAANELYILGSSSSSNYPTVAGTYDATNNGGTDIIVTGLNANGSALVGSTYIGGSNTDGQNSITDNYGDTYKGEITLDIAGNVYVASMSNSNNFPTTAGVVQSNNAGGQDGILFKFNPALNNLIWSTYVGGTGTDAAYSLVALNNGEVYACGTATNGYITTPGVAHPAFIGGTADGFVLHLNNTATTRIASTFLGTTARDQNFFIQIDKFGKVYINGQTTGTITVTPGAYSGPGNGSYIMRLTDDLVTVDLRSKYGTTAMTAFLVDDCNNIYAAGHGGLSQLSSPTYQITTGAFNSSGAGFYLLVLNPNASSLLFGTFYGNSGAHVDGGTSRFDPNGVVYENVCTSGGSPTMPWAYATNGLAGWDNYVFKIDFEATGVVANAVVNDFFSCDDPPFSIDFTGSGSSIPNHFWDFGDGNTSTLSDPTHVYADTGTYNVMYIAIDSASCNVADTAYATFTIAQAEEFSAQWSFNPPPPCEDTLRVAMAFSGTGADSIIWNMGNGTIFTDTAVNYFYTVPGTYTITMTAYDNICNHVETLLQTFTLDEGANTGELFLPNVFSPNNDTKNDYYKLAYADQPGVDPFPDLREYHIEIYNRWGKLVFESGEAISTWAWDGKINGKQASEGVYYYIVRYKGFCEASEEVKDTGFLTLLR